MNRRVFLTLLPLPAALYAQKPDDTPTIKVDVDLVSVTFPVRNKKGTLISNLTKDDFTVYEDGKEQDIRYFTRDTDLPLTIGMLVDVSRSQDTLIPEERAAASAFFRKVIGKKDQAFLISFGAEAELLQDLTNSHSLLERGLKELRLNAGVGGIHPSTIPTGKQKGTILYDAVYLAAAEQLKREVGRKAIILITDGQDFGSDYSAKQAIEASQKSDAIIYSIYYVDNRAYYGRGISFGGDGDLKKMSEETGGHLFHVGRNLTLDSIFDEIQQEMRSQYAISYAPTNTTRDGSFRKVEVKTKDKDLRVQVRKGYYATPR